MKALALTIVAMALVVGCSTSPAASAPTTPSASSAPAPSPTLVAQGAPACATPQAVISGATGLATWAASAGRLNTLAGSLTFQLRGDSVSSVDLVVGTPDAVSSTELFQPASTKVLARGVVPGFGAVILASYPFSLDYNAPSPGTRLPVFALVRYTTGTCHGPGGEAAEPLGWISVQ